MKDTRYSGIGKWFDKMSDMTGNPAMLGLRYDVAKRTLRFQTEHGSCVVTDKEIVLHCGHNDELKDIYVAEKIISLKCQ